jgi:hypothetical protein
MNATNTRTAAHDDVTMMTGLDDLTTPALLALADARKDATDLELVLAERLRCAWDELARMDAERDALAVA